MNPGNINNKKLHLVYMHFRSECVLLIQYSLNLFRFRGGTLLENNDLKFRNSSKDRLKCATNS